MKLADILKDSDYKLSQFTTQEIEWNDDPKVGVLCPRVAYHSKNLLEIAKMGVEKAIKTDEKNSNYLDR